MKIRIAVGSAKAVTIKLGTSRVSCDMCPPPGERITVK
jgi:hypothetical protein